MGERNSSNDGIERWAADSGAAFHMTKSAELLHEVQPADDKVKIGKTTLMYVECYGSITVEFLNRAYESR